MSRESGLLGALIGLCAFVAAGYVAIHYSQSEGTIANGAVKAAGTLAKSWQATP